MCCEKQLSVSSFENRTSMGASDDHRLHSFTMTFSTQQVSNAYKVKVYVLINHGIFSVSTSAKANKLQKT